MSADQRVAVCIIGGGPTGLTAANLLGARGVEVLLVERHAATTADAKAISLDDESLRTMQSAGLLPLLSDVVLPGTGTHYYGGRGQLLAAARGPQPPPLGHPVKSPFAQPELERVLLKALGRFATVEVALETELVSFESRQEEVELRLRPLDGSIRSIRCTYLLAADGGRSTVREAAGIRMKGSSFSQRWLVIDSLEDEHDQRYAMHHGDPQRPFVIIPGRNGRCRYEFLLHQLENPEAEPSLELIRTLLAPHRSIAAEQVERCAIYRFHALNATRWRHGRAFLLGDAAHMMPPFAGQGLNSGIRDAANLTWKIADALGGRGHDRLLDTYEEERRPHAQAMIDLSVRLGQIVMTTSQARAAARDAIVAVVTRSAHGRRYLSEMRFRPRPTLHTGFLAGSGELVGRLLPQPRVLAPTGGTVLLDEALGTGYTLLAVDAPDAQPALPPHEVWSLIEPTRVRALLDDRFPRSGGWYTIADYDGALRTTLAPAAGQFLLVRPDRYIAASFHASHADAVADELLARLR